MVKVINISTREFTFKTEISNKQNKDLQKCIEYLKKAGMNDQSILNILPDGIKYTIAFELKDSNVDLANAIRRCLTDEIEVYSMTFDEYELDKVEITDPYILGDFLRKQIELTPIIQDSKEIEQQDDSWEISLAKENNTDEIIDVMTNDLSVYYDKKKVELENFVRTNIVLCRLRPQEQIKISNIKVVRGIGRDDAGKFNMLSNITYKILDHDPLVEEKSSSSGKSSMVSNPTHFFISYSTHRNIRKPLKIMIKCCDNLINRLELVLKDMKNIKNSDDYYLSDLLELETTGIIKKINITGEYWTITNIICRYCYNLTNGNIQFISPAVIHPEKEIAIINIIHPEYSTLIQDAIIKIIKDLETVKRSF